MIEINLATIITSILSSAGVSGLAIYVLRNWILGEFKKDLENHKHTLQIEIIKAQLQSKELFSVYQSIYEKIEIAHGSASSIVSYFRETSDYSYCNSKDIERILSENNATSAKTEYFKNLFEINANARAKELTEYLESLRLNKAFGQCQEAKNEIILKALYLDDETENLALEIVNGISGALISYRTGVESEDFTLKKNANKEIEELLKRIKDLRNSMRKQLTPASGK